MPVDDSRPDALTYDLAPTESPSEGVVAAVAAATGADATGADSESDVGHRLDPLFSVVDPDALDAVFEDTVDGAPRPGGSVAFTYHGHAVTVCDRCVTVSPARPGPDRRVPDSSTRRSSP